MLPETTSAPKASHHRATGVVFSPDMNMQTRAIMTVRQTPDDRYILFSLRRRSQNAYARYFFLIEPYDLASTIRQLEAVRFGRQNHAYITGLRMLPDATKKGKFSLDRAVLAVSKTTGYDSRFTLYVTDAYQNQALGHTHMTHVNLNSITDILLELNQRHMAAALGEVGGVNVKMVTH